MINKGSEIKLVVVFFLIVIFVMLMINIVKTNNEEYFQHDIYYISLAENTLMPMKFKISYGTYEEEMEEIFDLMKNIQETPIQKSVIVGDGLIYNYELQENRLLIYLNPKVNELSTIDRMYLEGGLVWTYTGLPYIKEVAFGVVDNEGKISNVNNIYYYDRNLLKVNSVIAPEKIVTREIVLYFPKIETNTLEQETRSINYNSDKLIATYIVEQTIAGPLNSEHTSYISKNTQVNGIKIENKICYVDLSGDFINTDLLAYEQSLSIYSIVNALTELSEIDAVQILIDTNKYESYGEIDLTKPLGRAEEE